MRWQPLVALSHVRERFHVNFFTIIVFFVVFGVIFLSNLLLQTSLVTTTRSRFSEVLQEGIKTPPPVHGAIDALWQPVAGTRSKFFVYSAYVESRTIDAVRVIAAAKTHGADAVVCRLWLPNKRIITVKARVTPINEHWHLQYSASYVLCNLRNTGVRALETAGAVVAVLAEAVAHLAPTNLLPVLDTRPKPEIEDTLHVCVKPFYNGNSSEDWLVEWFELNRLLGVSHFYMYNESLRAPVACVLERYRREGLVTLLPWNLPFISRLEIRTGGQYAAFSDCLYRSMPSAGWLLIIDVDEVVIPQRERTLPALLSALRESSYVPPSAFLFRNAYFYLKWEDDAEAPAPLLTARKTRRWTVPHPNKNRTKYALRPTDVVELGNHFVWEFTPGAIEAAVPIDRALLHHYRALYLESVQSTVDRTAHRWTKELVPRVTAEKQQVAKSCPASEADVKLRHHLARVKSFGP
ncbi:uncharacterized protein [Choristoneura fumiferana]|uniref:uncharacterized protein n=1 Tax=Choristoneura fumiferana TaxID=7141 RepID=UPI003D1544BF